MSVPSLVPMLLTGAEHLFKIDGSQSCHFLQLINDASDVNDILRYHLPHFLPVQRSAVFNRLRTRSDLPVSFSARGKGFLHCHCSKGKVRLLSCKRKSEALYTWQNSEMWYGKKLLRYITYWLLWVSTCTWNSSYRNKNQQSSKLQFQF